MDRDFDVDNKHILWMLLKFYRQHELYDSLLTLALESGVSIIDGEIGAEMLYMQRLVLQGR